MLLYTPQPRLYPPIERLMTGLVVDGQRGQVIDCMVFRELEWIILVLLFTIPGKHEMLTQCWLTMDQH